MPNDQMAEGEEVKVFSMNDMGMAYLCLECGTRLKPLRGEIPQIGTANYVRLIHPETKRCGFLWMDTIGIRCSHAGEKFQNPKVIDLQRAP